MLEFFRFGESKGGSEFVEHSRTHYPMDMDNSSGKARVANGGERGTLQSCQHFENLINK